MIILQKQCVYVSTQGMLIERRKLSFVVRNLLTVQISVQPNLSAIIIYTIGKFSENDYIPIITQYVIFAKHFIANTQNFHLF